MSYNVVASLVPAVTGGLFDFSRSTTALGTLLTSPAYILATYITDNAIASMTDPEDADTWPLYVSYMPDSPGSKNNAAAFYDTSGDKDGRLIRDGEVIQHYGIQLMVRSVTHVVGWAKTEEIASALDVLSNVTVTVGVYEYQFYNFTRTSPVISLGVEEGTKNRRLFTMNFIITIKRIS
jgi:hypothetical protein